MKVVFTARARREMRDIGRYVARDDPEAAFKLTGELVKRCQALVSAPERGTIVATRAGTPIRRLVEGSYLILYSVSSQVVRIHRVTHGASSPKVLLKGIDL